MIVLNNYTTNGTYIVLNDHGYYVIDKNKINNKRKGVGGFTEENELVGIYVENDKLFFIYKDMKFEASPDEILCTNKILDNGMRNFSVTIKGKIVCNIVYKPYISPLALPFGDDEDEFDFLLYLSKLLFDKNSINNFIEGMKNLQNYKS